MDRLTFIKTVSKKAGELVFSSTPTKGIQEKQGRGNFVTQADLASEKLIMSKIRKHFPDDLILSEETDSTIPNPLLTDHLWIIDPIDGTHNFRYRRNYSSVSIGYAEKGTLVFGAIYDIFRHELYWAEKGNDAYFENEKMTVSTKDSLLDITFITDNSYIPENTKKTLHLISNLDPVPFVLMKGSAALEFCEIAGGKADLFYHNALKPWDNAAGFLIVQEAGGVVKTRKGKKASFMDCELICGNEKLVDLFLGQIKEY